MDIFQLYRQELSHTPSRRLGLWERKYNVERIWNSREGWFKLIHVCQRWLRVVLASSSRLHLQLVITPHRLPRADLMRRLSSLPIFIIWNRESNDSTKEFDRVFEAFPDRVRAISFQGEAEGIENVFRAMSTITRRRLCALELLDLYSWSLGVSPLFFPNNFSASSLKCLRVREGDPQPLIPLLSTATQLVELSLGSIQPWGPSEVSSFFSHLQQMPCLCRLEIAKGTAYDPSAQDDNESDGSLDSDGPLDSNEPLDPNEPLYSDVYKDLVPLTPVATLPKLNTLVYYGPVPHFEGMVEGLCAQSLQHLCIHFHSENPLPHIPHLAAFVRNIAKPFRTLQVAFGFNFEHPGSSHLMRSDSMVCFGIVTPAHMVSTMQMIGKLFVFDTVGTVDQLILAGDDMYQFTTRLLNYTIHLRRFFKLFYNVKVIRVKQGLELQVAKSLQQDNEGSALDFLPMLEEIHFIWFSRLADTAKAEYTQKTFEPVVTARQRMGRPVRLTWSSATRD